jgi:unsaturated rhamnogalacturonyl hydrolase
MVDSKRILKFTLLFVVAGSILFQTSLAIPPAERIVIMQDLYHHLPPENDQGSYESSRGRYTWFDRTHPNGFSSLRLELIRNGFDVASTTREILPETLKGVDVFLLVHPDSQKYLDRPNLISQRDVAALRDFVRSGGGLMIITNSYGDPDWPKEDFELEHTNLLAREFGVQFRGDQTGHVDITIPNGNSFLTNAKRFHYGNGCTLQILPKTEAEVQVVLDYQGKPIIALSQLGKGKALFIGDSGSWGNGNIYRPGCYNAEIAVALFKLIAPKKKSLVDDGRRIELVKKAPSLPNYEVIVRRTVGSVKTLELMDQLNQTSTRQQLNHYTNQTWSFRLDMAASSAAGKERTPKLQGSVAASLKSLLSKLQSALPERLRQDAVWRNSLPVRILPLDELKPAEHRDAGWVFRYVGMEEFRKTKCAKLQVLASLDLTGLELTDFISAGEIHRINLKVLSIAGGRQNCEISCYVRSEDGAVLGGQIHMSTCLWLNPGKSIDRFNVGLGDLAAVFISEGSDFSLLP